MQPSTIYLYEVIYEDFQPFFLKNTTVHVKQVFKEIYYGLLHEMS